MDKRNARDGESLEEIGTYDNITDPKQTKVVVKADRARYWLSVGAQPSRMVHHIFKRNGVYAKPEAAAPAAAPAPAPAKKK
jgi:small subunit ribosomal protein S16